jgi:choline dehydrogenase-like flavoprotein
VNPIKIDAASRESWDVICVGTSFSTMFFARELPKGTRVLFVEKGRRHTHAERVAGRSDFGREEFIQRNAGPIPKEWTAHSTFGGNSNCWWACTPRFHPDDFQTRSRHGVGMDWPVSYDQLEEAYCSVEEAMEVAGGGSDRVLPRSRAFPFPPHRPSRSDLRLQEHSPLWWAQPTARSNGGSRPRCCGNGFCNICPVDSKFSILNSIHLFERPDFHFLSGVEARSIDRSAGIATGLICRTPDGHELRLAGNLFALGANAIFNAAILLRSRFRNPALGHYLNEQVSTYATIDTAIPNLHGGTSITGHGYHFYAGDHRSDSGAVLMENWNSPTRIRLTPGRWTERLYVKLIAADLPRFENHVSIEEDEPALHWSGFHPYAIRGLDRARNKMAEAIPTEIESIEFSESPPTEDHIQGTTRMGHSADEGVVDASLRTFECRNVLALGAGAFPSCSPANPTLTLSALSVHAARSL